MKKKFLIALGAAMGLAALSLTACNETPKGPLTPIADIPDAATVEVGGIFDFETTAVAVGKKIYLPKTVTITFGEDENVEFTGMSFTPAKVGGYTVTYTFDIEGETKTYTTAVTACDTTKPSILLSGTFPVRVDYDAEITLPAFTAVDICDGALVPDVKVYQNNAAKTPLTVTDGKFTVNTYDGVVIEATATDAAGNTATDGYTIAVRGEREVDYFENEPYSLANAVGFGGGKTQYNGDPAYCIQGNGSMKFYTDVNGKWVFCGFSSIGEAVRLAGGKDGFKAAYSAVTMLLYNASPYDCEIEFQSWERNPENGLAQNAKLIQKDWLVANCWTKISVPADKIAEGYDDGVFFGLFFNGSGHEANNAYANFCVYADCIRLSKEDDTAGTVIPLTDVTQKLTGDTADAELVRLSALTGIDLTKLTVSAEDKDGTPVRVEKTETAFVLKNAGAGRYTVQYMYANGENIDVFSQTVTLYKPIENPYFEGFEGEGYTHTEKLIAGAASVEISTEQAHSGTHSMKVTTGEWSRYTYIPLMLDGDMLQAIKNASGSVELSVWLYIANANSNVTGFNVRFHGLTKNATSGAYECGMLTLGGYGNKNNVPTGQWLQVKFNATDNDTISQIKENGGIVLDLEILVADTNQTVGFTYYVDDLEVTDVDTDVTMTLGEKTVRFESGAKVELANLADFSGVDTEKLTITCNGEPIEWSVESGKITFTPAEAGRYELVYTHRNGHKIATATQAVTVFTPLVDPYFEGFEGGGRTHTLTPKGTATISINDNQAYAHSGTHSLKIENDMWSGYTFIPLMLDEDIINNIGTDDELSIWLYIANKSSDITQINVRFAAYDATAGDLYRAEGLALGGYGNKNNVPTGEWLQIKFSGDRLSKVKVSGGITLYLEITSSNACDLTYYIDDIEIISPDTDVTMTLAEKTVRFESGAKVELANLADFSGVDTEKLTITCNGEPIEWSVESGKLVFAPAEAGRYELVYTHRNGHKVATATQVVTVWAPLSDPYFEGFEGGGRTHTLTPKGTATVSVNDNQAYAHSGTHSLKIVNDTWSGYTFIPLILDEDIINNIGTDDELSIWLYIANKSSDITQINVRFAAYDATAGDLYRAEGLALGGYGNKNNVPAGQWLQIKFSGDRLSKVKASGGITLYLEIVTGNACDLTYYVDDIEIISPDTSVVITAEDKAVAFAEGTAIEIASFAGANFNAENLTVTMNGTAYTGYTFANGKLSFMPSSAGEYVFAYTHKNGHFVKTATQTVTVYVPLTNPVFDGFEENRHATVLANTLDGVALDNHEVIPSPFWEHTAHSGSKMMYVKGNTFNNKVILLQLATETADALTVNDTLSFWIYVNGGPGDKWITNASVYANNNGTYAETEVRCEDYGVDKTGSLTKKTWYEVKIKLPDQNAVDILKVSKTIGLSIDLGGEGFEFFLDDIQVTHA